MNFKTTIILLVLVAAVGTYVYFSGGNNAATTASTDAASTARKVFDVDAANVTAVTVTPADGQPLAMEKAGEEWRMTQPVKAAAEKWAVDDLVRAVAELQSRSQVDPAAAPGLEKPNYKVSLVAGGKTYDLTVGDRSAVGDNLYVRRADAAKADVVDGSLIEKLDKPASEYRDKRLATAASTDVRQLRITSAQGTVAVEKRGADWRITEPAPMPADTAAVSDLLFAVTGLRAEAFENDNPDLATSTIGPPRVTVQYSTEPPATQPTTGPSAMKTVTLGRFADVLKKDVLATSTDLPGVARVPASAIESLSKRPLDLRDKEVLDVDPERISTLSVRIQPGPSTQPAGPREYAITRRPPPPAPATSPATQAAATQPATKPAESKWVVTGSAPAATDDAAIDGLLAALHPLKAEKFLAAPSTQPAVTTYVLSGATAPQGPALGETFKDLTITDLGADHEPVGSYDGAVFELPRLVIDRLKAPLTKP